MNLTDKTQYIIFGTILAILVLTGVYEFSQGHLGGESISRNQAATSTFATTTTYLSPTTVLVSAPSGSYTELSISNQPTAPSYKGALTCPGTMAQDVCQSLQTKDSTIVSMLNKNPTNFAAWIDLGTIRKETDDNAGAAAAWIYLTEIYSTSPIAFNNLGDLYMNFVKNYPKAEAEWLAAIKLKANDPAPYENLFALYTTTSYKPSASAAANILKTGIAANPNSVDLKVLLARYYKSQGDSVDAEAEYQAAIQTAQSQRNASLVQQIQAEASAH